MGTGLVAVSQGPRRAAVALLDLAERVVIRLIATVAWPFRTPSRMLWLAWMVGFFAVGQAQSAVADDLIVSPSPPDGAQPTPFEAVSLASYSLPVFLSDSHHGAPYVQETMWNMVNAVGNVLLYLTFSLIRGAIACMQWMLQLNIYQENKVAIDNAVLGLANQIFWPLFGATLAIAGVAMYARMKREGGGSIFNDAVWCIAASVLAVTFAGIPGSENHYTAQQQQQCQVSGVCPNVSALGPSTVMSDLDDLRRLIGVGAIKGFASSSDASKSAAGFPAVQYGTGSGTDPTQLDLSGVNAVRKLADSMWNVYAVTPWCYAMFNSVTACGHDSGTGTGEGAHYLLRDATWTQRTVYFKDHPADGQNGDQATCPAEWAESGTGETSHAQCNWIRGQSFGRLGMVVLVTFVSIPMALLLLALVLYGVMAIVGFILLLLVGLLFLLGWMIPGRMRQIGVRWFETVLASLLQSVIITTVLGAVMVLGGILNKGIPSYGYFMVVLLHFAVFIAAFKMRGHFENITQMSSATSTSPVSQYMAMKTLSALGRAGRSVRRTPGQVVGAGKGASRYVRDSLHKDSGLAPLRSHTPPFKANTGNRLPTAPMAGSVRPGGQRRGGVAAGTGPGSSASGSTGPNRAGGGKPPLLEKKWSQATRDASSAAQLAAPSGRTSATPPGGSAAGSLSTAAAGASELASSRTTAGNNATAGGTTTRSGADGAGDRSGSQRTGPGARGSSVMARFAPTRSLKPVSSSMQTGTPGRRGTAAAARSNPPLAATSTTGPRSSSSSRTSGLPPPTGQPSASRTTPRSGQPSAGRTAPATGQPSVGRATPTTPAPRDPYRPSRSQPPPTPQNTPVEPPPTTKPQPSTGTPPRRRGSDPNPTERRSVPPTTSSTPPAATPPRQSQPRSSQPPTTSATPPPATPPRQSQPRSSQPPATSPMPPPATAPRRSQPRSSQPPTASSPPSVTPPGTSRQPRPWGTGPWRSQPQSDGRHHRDGDTDGDKS